MSAEDYERARQNRERQHIVYPDTNEETEESKAQRREERRRQRASVAPVIKKQPVWDSENMRMIWK